MSAARDGSQQPLLCKEATFDCMSCADIKPQGPPAAAPLGRRLRGLSWNKTHQCWRVRIYCAGKLRFVGRYKDAITAARAYDKAAVYLYGVNAITNFRIQACLADLTTEIGSCIVRAKLEAEEAAAAKQPRFGSTSTSVTAAAAAAVGTGSHRNLTRSGSCGGSSVSSFDTLQHNVSLSGTGQGNIATVAAVDTGADLSQQQQQQQQRQLLVSNASCIGSPSVQPHACSSESAAAAAAACSLHSHLPEAQAGVPRKPSMVLPLNDRLGLYQQQQQQMQMDLTGPAAGTRTLSLPSIQCHHQNAAAAITAATMFPAAASINKMAAAAQSSEPASLVELLLQAEQQQQQQQQLVMMSDLVHGCSPPPPVQTSTFLPLQPTSAAGSVMLKSPCQQQQQRSSILEQPLLLNVQISSLSKAAGAAAAGLLSNAPQPAAAAAAATTSDFSTLQQILNWQQQQQQQTVLMTCQESQTAAAQSVALEQYLHALTLRAPTYPACSDNAMHGTAAAAAATIAGSSGSSMITGNSSGISPVWPTQI